MTDAPIAYILKRYPRFSETFVVNEILAHEAAGQAIEIYALGPVQETHFQEAIARVRAPVRRIRHQYHDTELYWQLLTKAHATLPAFDANAALAENHSAATIGQAAVLAPKLHERGIRHLHAHFGTQAATIARLAARFAAVTYSITAHAKDIYHEYSEPVNLARKIADAAFTITVSDYNLAHLREQYPAEAPVYRIYNGLDLEQFPYHAPENRPPPLLAVGRLVEKKGFPDLIDAIAALRERGINCTCDIIGDGNQRETLAAHIARLHLEDRVRLLGNRSQAEVKNHIRQAAMLIAPSIISADGDRDGLPTILVEAMALGTPCISTNIVGIPELVRDGDTGLLAPPNDPPALADTIARLLNDPALAARLATNASTPTPPNYANTSAPASRGKNKIPPSPPASPLPRRTRSVRSGGGTGLPLKKADAFFKGTRGGGVKKRVATATKASCK